jgi:cardiolipin synthase
MTISRIIGSIAVPFLIMVDTPQLRLLAFILFTIAAFTDWLDGYLARQLNASTSLGRMLDPIADKLLVAGTLLALASIDNWSWLMFIPAVLILTREVFVSGLREYMSGFNMTIHVTLMAKYKTTFQLIALGFAIVAPTTPVNWQIPLITTIMIWIAAVMTVITGWDYLRKTLAHDRTT